MGHFSYRRKRKAAVWVLHGRETALSTLCWFEGFHSHPLAIMLREGPLAGRPQGTRPCRSSLGGGWRL